MTDTKKGCGCGGKSTKEKPTEKPKPVETKGK